MAKTATGILVICAMLAGAALAHPPYAVEANYDGISGILTLDIFHSVKDPRDHFVYNVRVLQGKDKLLEQSFYEQLNDQKQILKIYLPRMDRGTKLSVKAYCNKYGEFEETVEVPVLGYTDVTPAQVQALMEEVSDLVVIDVSPDYEDGHLPGARYIYVTDLEKKLNSLDRSKPTLIYCHCIKDAPSIAAAEILANNGFSKVYRLKGHFSAWVEAGYRIEK